MSYENQQHNKEPKPDAYWIRQNGYAAMNTLKEMVPILADIRDKLTSIRDKVIGKIGNDQVPF